MRQLFITAISAFVLPLLLTIPAHAGVVDSSAAGFTVTNTIVVRATPDDAYRAAATEIGSWWNPEHTYSGKAENMSIDIAGTGCFCEKLDNGGYVRHMTVVYANPGKTLRLSGGLGPVQELGATGSLTFEFKVASVGTAIELTYTVGGYRPGGLAALAGVVDRVLAEQLDRLKRYIDTGSAAPGR